MLASPTCRGHFSAVSKQHKYSFRSIFQEQSNCKLCKIWNRSNISRYTGRKERESQVYGDGKSVLLRELTATVATPFVTIPASRPLTQDRVSGLMRAYAVEGCAPSG